jgi:GMP synthase (glutamine-hydrolysing)
VPSVRAAHGDFDAQFRAAIGDAWSGRWSTADARELDVALPTRDDLAGVIVTGSASSVTDRLAEPWMLRLEAWLRGAVADQLPVLGVCFGHQLLASALGGEVRVNPRGRAMGSREVRRVADDPLFEGIPERFAVSLSHRDHVAVAPPSATHLVTADHDDFHAFAAGPFARAVQFHPEFDAAIARGYLEARRDVLRTEGLDPEALLRDVVDVPYGPRLLRNFVTELVARRTPR